MNARQAFLILSVIAAGCFYPPAQKPLPVHANEITLPIPYDLGWDAVHAVIVRNDYHVVTENPDAGTIEAQVRGGFTLKDADCGKLKGIGRRYAAEPDPDASAVYDFAVKPKGNEATVVGVQATFSAPLQVPFHPMSGVRCASRGRQEARLLREISAQAHNEHRIDFKPHPGKPPKPAPLPARQTVE
jgi:hypothetical protein